MPKQKIKLETCLILANFLPVRCKHSTMPQKSLEQENFCAFMTSSNQPFPISHKCNAKSLYCIWNEPLAIREDGLVCAIFNNVNFIFLLRMTARRCIFKMNLKCERIIFYLRQQCLFSTLNFPSVTTGYLTKGFQLCSKQVIFVDSDESGFIIY